MNYREHYAKPAAIQLYLRGASRSEVVQLLQEEGAGSQAEALADEYYQNSQTVLAFQQKKKRKAADTSIMVGIVFLAASVSCALITYLGLNGGAVLPGGLLLCGIIAVVKGLLDRKSGS